MSPNALVRFLVASLMLGLVTAHAYAQSDGNDAAFLTNAPTDPNSLIPPPLPKTADAPSATEAPKDTFKGTFKTPSDQTVSKTEIKDMSLKGPDADSPFFTERQEAKAAMAEAGREGFGMYVPKPPHPPIQQQMKKFFNGMFGSGKAGKHEATPMILTLSPSDISLSQTSELDVTLKLSNAQKQELEILYPDNQRLEILTKDSSGNIVNRWSQDRAFEHTKGFVAVNPQEFITYTEKIATTGMKAGETYTIEVSLANQQGFVASTKVTPQP
ncbi:MAG: hypothetical protein K8R57_00670 [Verrucomicrobia bacterium]|nr:hypothetical protein [Verrucomicrobiota bacterium]